MHQVADSAHALVKSLVEMREQSRRLDVMSGGVLWRLKANNLYRSAFGDGVDTWDEFLRSPEIALSVSSANRMMQLYEYFVLKYGYEENSLADVPVKSLNHLLPRLKSGDLGEKEVDELIESARTLTFNQFKERVYDVMNDGEDTRTYTFLVMRKCNETNSLSVVRDITSEDILTNWPCLRNTQ